MFIVSDTTAGFARLRDEVSLRDPAEAGYPRRTGAVFRALERKYRWKRAGR